MTAPVHAVPHTQPEASTLREAVLRGLAARPRAVPPVFLYDGTGARLFDAICETPEYYPTRTECAILQNNAETIAETVGRGCLFIEPGAGNSRKVQLLLEAARPVAYLPVDICPDYLERAGRELRRAFPWLALYPTCADFTRLDTLPDGLPAARRVVFFPGSTIGNFEPAAALEFLSRLARLAGPGGGLLIGVDLKKDPAVLDAAYNDAAGITAAFNLNLLVRINRELAADFLLLGFEHRAFYNSAQGRVEMHLVSRTAQTVTVAGERFHFAAGESIHTENSYKYTVTEFQALAATAGFSPVRVWCDPQRLFSLHYLDVPPLAGG